MVTVMKKYRHLTYQLSTPPCAPFNCCREKVNEKIIWQVNQYQFKVRRKKNDQDTFALTVWLFEKN